MKESEIIGVAEHIFGCSFASCSEIKEFVEPQKESGSEATPDPSQYTPADVKEVVVAQSQKESGSEATPDPACGLADIFTITHNLSEEEPPGYLPLGYMIVCFCKLLSRKLNAVYRCQASRGMGNGT